jgi:dihydrofolate synthase/folylpolyglutamate synthase
VLPGRPTVVLDVAHNPHAARALAAALGAMGFHPETHAVFGMLADKDIPGVIEAVKPRIDHWYVAGLPGPRGASVDALVLQLRAAGIAPTTIRTFDSIGAAYVAAHGDAADTDRIVVFGSFLTVAAVLAAGRSA